MKKLLLTILVSLYLFTHLFGQSILKGGFVKGYYIKRDDTTHCWIKKQGFLYKDIAFKLSEDGEVQKISPTEISGFGIGTSVYEEVYYGEENFLLHVLIKGKVSLYEDTEGEYSANQVFSHYEGIIYGSGVGRHYGSSYTLYSTYYIQKDDEVVKLDERSFLKDMTSLFDQDSNLIEKLEKYDWNRVYEEIQAIVNNYNTFLDGR